MSHENLAPLWASVLGALQARLPALEVTTWLWPLSPLELDRGRLTLAAPSAFHAEWVGKHHLPLLSRAVRDAGLANSVRLVATQGAPCPSRGGESPAVGVTDQQPYVAERPVPVPRVRLDVVQTLTACLDRAACPKTARTIYRFLFELALEVQAARGFTGDLATVAVFHLPLELLAAHLEVDRTTIWRNIRPLIERGVLATRDHYDTLRGQTAVSGKLWAISLFPERILSGQASRVRISADDLRFNWRNLDRDARQGRTVYGLTRAEAVPSADSEPLQQSVKSLKTAIGRGEVLSWALRPFLNQFPDVTLTVAAAAEGGLDAVFSLGSLALLSKRDRGHAVEATARQLASTFADTQHLRFWCWLVWQLIRGIDQGQDWSENVAVVLARTWRDARDEGGRKPAALAVAALSASGLLDALRSLPPTRVGVRPAPVSA